MLEWEEDVGKAWDRFLIKRTSLSHPEARVEFTSLSKQLKIFYHLLGGDKGKALKVTDKRSIRTKRNFLQKISGYGKNFYLTWSDQNAVYLPNKLDILPTKEQNSMLYFWLVAMSVQVNYQPNQAINEVNQKAVTYLCDNYSGFKSFYEKSLDYLITRIPALSYLKDQAPYEEESFPCALWVYPPLYTKAGLRQEEDEEEQRDNSSQDQSENLQMKKKANQMNDKKETDGFMAFIPEGLMSILEQINIDRSEDDSFDKDALYNAEDLDEITIGMKKANLKARLKMDLDLQAHMDDEYPIEGGYMIDEWHYEKKQYLENYVKINPIIAKNVEAIELPKRLHKTVKQIQSQLDLLEINRYKNNRLPYGDEICMDTWIEYKGHQNKSLHHQKFFENFEKKTRDMATLILADISLSTEAGISQE